ncbi:sensor domain-containing diguanylate cyclase [Vibrio sp. S17_S38]|uniref:sensor domain-containing diguanylate cyclase n=1 Tax=Vibrio sp. S17_S38 TaxID=2720229 RepID=UPI001680A37B|nr:diguanylate cyclase [Vibrio sp. S17_S38]MBD1572347.1 sensor domain-containing diguanylate cyclase [Vibrio sp. S17_S38]
MQNQAPSIESSTTEYPLLLNTFKRFSWMLLILLCILFSIGYLIFQNYQQDLRKHLLDQEEAFVSTTTQLLKKEMYEQLVLLQMTVNSKSTSEFIQTPSDTNRVVLEGLLENLANTFKHFGQVRLLDNTGHEIIRINYDGKQSSVVPLSELQNKADRYYTQQGLKLKAGEVFVSKMDLNQEQGKIEYPLQPVLRFVTPVMNNQNQLAGLMILNYLPNDILKSFKQQMALRLSAEGMLIDAKGFWISSHDKHNEWGESLGNLDRTLQKSYPNAAQTILTNESGTLKTQDGLFRYESLQPFNFKKSSLSLTHRNNLQVLHVTEESQHNTDWKLIVFISNEAINAQSFFFKPSGIIIIIIITLSLCSILLLLVYLSISRKKQRFYHKQINQELSALYEDAPCGYHSLNSQGYVTRVNNTELNWLGYSREEVIGQHFSQFLTQTSLSVFEQFLSQLKYGQNIDNLVLEIVCKNGETFFASIAAKSVMSQGQFVVARNSVFNISDRIALERELHYIAHTDVLTGISNRRHFFKLADKKLHQAQKTSAQVTLLMLDIDHFKTINDQHGHDIGDMVLKKLAELIQNHITENVLFARLGGEEFALLTTGLSEQQSLALGNQLRDIIQSNKIEINVNKNLQFTVSIGITIGTQANINIDQILKLADMALYQAKNQGRNKVIMINNE